MISGLLGAYSGVTSFAQSFVRAGNSVSGIGRSVSGSLSKIRPGAVGRDLARLRMKAFLRMDPAGFVYAMQRMGEDAMELMANDTREKIVNSLMGNRKDPYNVFPKNKINPSTGQYYKNSIARPFPKAPRPYTRPGEPIALQQVIYRKQKDTRSSIMVEGKKIDVSEYVVGPIAQGAAATTKGTPGILEKGGNVRSFYRFMPAKVGTFRQEFSAKRKPTKMKQRQDSKQPFHYMSWQAVNDAMRAQGKQVGGKRTRGSIDTTSDPIWRGPSTFRVRGRYHASKAWDRVKKRAPRMMNIAKSRLPWYMAKLVRLKNQKLKAVQGASK